MSTLIRVRGRRGNKRQKIEQLQQGRDEARQDVVRTELDKKVQLKYLEILPIEILQKIFIESRNPSFAAVSKRMRSQVLSPYTKLQITTRVCRAVQLGDRGRYSDWTEEDKLAVNSLRVLLGQPWFDYSLFEAARQQWLLKTAVHKTVEALTEDQADGDPLSEEVLQDITARVRAVFDSTRKVPGEDDLPFPIEDHASELCKSSSWPTPSELPREDNCIVCYISHGSQQVWVIFSPCLCPAPNRFMMRNESNRTCTVWEFMSYVPSRRHIPSSLVHKPFTQSKGDLLGELTRIPSRPRLSPGLEMDNYLPRYVIKAWEDGLEDALTDANEAAVAYALAPFIGIHGWNNAARIQLERWLMDATSIFMDPNHAYHRQGLMFARPTMKNVNWPLKFQERHVVCCMKNIDKNPSFYLRALGEMAVALYGSPLTSLSQEGLNTMFLKSKSLGKELYRTGLKDIYELFAFGQRGLRNDQGRVERLLYALTWISR